MTFAKQNLFEQLSSVFGLVCAGRFAQKLQHGVGFIAHTNVNAVLAFGDDGQSSPLHCWLGFALGLDQLRPDGLPVLRAQLLASYSAIGRLLNRYAKLGARNSSAGQNLIQILFGNTALNGKREAFGWCNFIHALYSIVSIERVKRLVRLCSLES